MSKEIIEYSGKLIIFETILPVTEVIFRLERELTLVDPLAFKSKDELVDIITQATADADFVLFSVAAHSRWLNMYHAINTVPVTHLYTFGNPLIAQGILGYDIRAALNIPPRLLVTEKEDHSGTKVLYHLPSSVMVVGDNNQMREAVEALDAKVEKLVEKITSV